ncbi:vesicle-associated membrane protein 7B [Monocercomonoides exilis]|uniref:vesicle-associated membrane protein 7B n=1 Tax=Monocercomonoides exilis TaxID=2049356 RepID=UPI003559E5A9|nr:vesicle-associated membrane protein 7B [Monocercomonoides exilis]|eukprot:MONOS_11327.1-p1 / transcript=MONOS_11327.1 / gene=MONOS_11327 / organism=Monocercomonoides_exilis_PA203 / gene_product= vesicle-associated membrane protein 7B / transcript_product= vesicle-associated membrane protein 7B / location=Mono_scaffold00563:11717-12738(-) / protein_length=233 / sequence_SO=supercontig / SO=protein_coding / is_pseudo=false
MPILYAVIAKNQSILVEAEQTAGNFREIASKILAKVPKIDAKLSYHYDDYTFHYIIENQVVYMCMTDDRFDRCVAFGFLTDTQQTFISRYGYSLDTSSSYQFRDFRNELLKLMKQFSAQSNDRIARAKEDVNLLRGTVEENIDKVLDRQEKIELLVDRSESLAQNSLTFKKKGTQLKKKMWWQNCKLWTIVIIILLVLIFIIVVSACGGFTFKNCRKHEPEEKKEDNPTTWF